MRFGTTVEIEAEDGQSRTWTIVGEDEADAASGTVSHVSPLARALFGKAVGESALVGGRNWEIVQDLGRRGGLKSPRRYSQPFRRKNQSGSAADATIIRSAIG